MIVPKGGSFSKGWVRRHLVVLALLELLWVYGVKIRWHRYRGRLVLCDRYLWDTAIDFRLISLRKARSLLVVAAVGEDIASTRCRLFDAGQRGRIGCRSVVKGEPFPDPPDALRRGWPATRTSSTGFRSSFGWQPPIMTLFKPDSHRPGPGALRPENGSGLTAMRLSLMLGVNPSRLSSNRL